MFKKKYLGTREKMSDTGNKTLLLIAITICLVLVINPNVLSNIGLMTKRAEAPRRVLSSAEVQLFTTTAVTGEIVMVGTNGVLIDQGSNALRVGNSSIQMITGGVERIRINSNGQVGIGTTDPQSKLDVRGNILLSGTSDNNIGFFGQNPNIDGSSQGVNWTYQGPTAYITINGAPYVTGRNQAVYQAYLGSNMLIKAGAINSNDYGATVNPIVKGGDLYLMGGDGPVGGSTNNGAGSCYHRGGDVYIAGGITNIGGATSVDYVNSGNIKMLWTPCHKWVQGTNSPTQIAFQIAGRNGNCAIGVVDPLDKCTLTVTNNITIKPQSFKVGGNRGTYYKVRIESTDLQAPPRFSITRGDVHADAMWTGSMDLSVEFRGNFCGNGSDYLAYKYRQYCYENFNYFVARVSIDDAIEGGCKPNWCWVYLNGNCTYNFVGEACYLGEYNGTTGIYSTTTVDPQFVSAGYGGSASYDSRHAISTVNGNVGIGTTSPAFTTSIAYSGNNDNSTSNKYNFGLEVHNKVSGGPNNDRSNLILFSDGNATQAAMGGYRVSSAQNRLSGLMFLVGNAPTGAVGAFPGSTSDASASLTEAMRITPSGDVGIGKMDPGYKLDVNGDARVNGSLYFATPTGDHAGYITCRAIPSGQGSGNERSELILFQGNDNRSNGSGPDTITLRAPFIRLQTFTDSRVGDINSNEGSNDRLVVDCNGNVGIGTMTPETRLHLEGSGDMDAGNKILIRNASASSSAYSMMSIGNDLTTSYFNIFRNSSTRTDDGGVNTTTLRNDGGSVRLMSNAGKGIIVQKDTGYVGINNSDAQCPLHVMGARFSQGNHGYSFFGNGDSQLISNVMAQKSFSTSIYGQYCIVAGDAIVSTSMTLWSDIRIKKNIHPKTDILSLINKVNLYAYDHIDQNKGHVDVGVIAQEIREVLPSLVTSTKDYLPNVYKIASGQEKLDDHVRVYVKNSINSGDTVKIYLKKNVDIEHTSMVFAASFDFIDVSVWDDYSELDKVFVYGSQDQEVLAVDKVQLGLAALGGVKELSIIVQEQQQMINEQQRSLVEQSQVINDLVARLSRMETILSRVIA